MKIQRSSSPTKHAPGVDPSKHWISLKVPTRHEKHFCDDMNDDRGIQSETKLTIQ